MPCSSKNVCWGLICGVCDEHTELERQMYECHEEDDEIMELEKQKTIELEKFNEMQMEKKRVEMS